MQSSLVSDGNLSEAGSGNEVDTSSEPDYKQNKVDDSVNATLAAAYAGGNTYDNAQSDTGGDRKAAGKSTFAEQLGLPAAYAKAFNEMGISKEAGEIWDRLSEEDK